MRWAFSEVPIVKRLMRTRWLQFGLTACTLGVFVLAVLAGLFGTPAGNHNFGIVFVWIVWWALLMLMLAPFLGRLWCGICPIPAPGEWLQRRTLVQPRPGRRLYTLHKKWPRFLKNIWAQNFGFLGVALFSAVILTSQLVTGLVLLGFILLSIITSVLFERRTFCRYLCPIGGFIGLYSQAAPIEVRVKDQAACLSYKEKTCYTGSDEAYGCPWLNFPGALEANTFCGMCTECLKSCPKDNVALYIRRPGADLMQTQGHRLDEAYKGLIMLGAAFAYSTVLIGPYGWLKAAARAVGTPGWFAYAGGFLLLTLGIVPGIFWLCVHLGRVLSPLQSSDAAGAIVGRTKRTRGLFADYAAVLVPLGLAVWMAFTLSFALVNFSYAWPAETCPGSAKWTQCSLPGRPSSSTSAEC